jgi:ATP-dependent Lon protease
MVNRLANSNLIVEACMDSRHKPARRTATTYGRAVAEPPTSMTLLDGADYDGSDANDLILPILPIRDAVILPNMVVPLFIDQPGALRAVEAAMAADRMIVAVAQRDSTLSNPRQRDLHSIGTECSIGRMLRMPDGTHNVVLQGQRRVRVEWWLHQSPFGQARVTPHEEPDAASSQVEALRRAALSLLERCTKISVRLTEDTYIQALNIVPPGALADFICAQLEPTLEARQELLETFDTAARLRKVCRLISAELEVLELEHKIQDEVQQEVDRGQREFYLREQLKAIQRELGEHDPTMRESLELRETILARQMPADAQTRALKELQRLEGMPSMAPEYSVLRTYLDWLTTVPWHERTTDDFDLRRVAETLDAHHFGLERVKDRVIEHLAVRKLAPSGRAPILCLAGPPGVGKTSLGRSIAESLGRKFVRVSLGGVRDEAEIRGHRRTYVGALPGRIIQAMKQAQVVNPVFVLDEIDKLASDFRGDPAAAMLEVLDPEQNARFSDHYLEAPYDLSQVFFVLTANVISAIPGPLRDRMEVIEIPGYTEEEKAHIARRFLIPRQMEDAGLSPLRVEIEDGAVRRIIREYTFEAGVRGLEREIGGIMRKVARRVVEGRRQKALVTEARVASYLGPQRHFSQDAAEHDEIGVATGLAWTAAGGELTTVEVLAVPGHGTVALTGQLGDVMKESAHAALTYVRGRATEMGLEPDFHERMDMHVHLPSGAIPKDGPSAGITMAVAIVSALTGRCVRRDVAMTGEVTLRGRVLPVGGIKEKVLAAHRSGIHTVLLPSRNVRELDDLPEDVRESLRLIPIDSMDQVIASALMPAHCIVPAEPNAPAPRRAPHPPLTIADPIAATSRMARPRARRVVAVAP